MSLFLEVKVLASLADPSPLLEMKCPATPDKIPVVALTPYLKVKSLRNSHKRSISLGKEVKGQGIRQTVQCSALPERVPFVITLVGGTAAPEFMKDLRIENLGKWEDAMKLLYSP